MAEKVVSPGVFTNEIDASFLPAAIGEIGGAVIGPTVKGPALIPTVVESYAEFEAKFGSVFKSGSNYYQYLTSHTVENYLKHSGKCTIVRILDGTYSPATAQIPTGSGNYYTGSAEKNLADADSKTSVTLTTHADGAILNNRYFGTSDGVGVNDKLVSGSVNNLRWEITNVSPKKGTFSLAIRQGNDTEKRKSVLETWNNLSLDPNSNNYAEKVIGNSVNNFKYEDGEAYIQPTGEYPNKSKFVRIQVNQQTVDYLDENGDVRVAGASASLPGLGSGSWAGSFKGGQNGHAGFDALGKVVGSYTSQYLFYDSIADANSQGFDLTSATMGDETGGGAYMKALALLANQDEYDINLILIPGIIDNLGKAHTGIVTKAIDVCEARGDCFLVYDAVEYGQTNIATVTGLAEGRDTNYAATYWPWVQVPDSKIGTARFVPPSVVVPGIYAFNDKVAHPWFAPAGLNRGGIETAIQAERKLTHKNRDDLYEANVNPIATFPGQGVCIWGQKTLQKKASALDRVNVRRLMITVKKFIASSSRFLVFEQNTALTRKRFLSIVNPYLEQVQSNSGLSAFKVIMDETNNTPDLVDRNILYGQIFLQPTRTAEFIVLDFTVQPTGAAFPE